MCLTLLLEGSNGEAGEERRHEEDEERREHPAWAREEGWQFLGVEEEEDE